jgi:hypothetical protein
MGNAEFHKIIERIKNNDPLLTHVDLTDYELYRSDAKDLADALKRNTHLTELAIKYCDTNMSDGYGLAPAIRINSGLTVLRVSSVFGDVIPDAALLDATRNNNNRNILTLDLPRGCFEILDNQKEALKLAEMLRDGSVDALTNEDLWNIEARKSAIKEVGLKKLNMSRDMLQKMIATVEKKLEQKAQTQETAPSQPEKPLIQIYSPNYKGEELEAFKAKLINKTGGVQL